MEGKAIALPHNALTKLISQNARPAVPQLGGH